MIAKGLLTPGPGHRASDQNRRLAAVAVWRTRAEDDLECKSTGRQLLANRYAFGRRAEQGIKIGCNFADLMGSNR